MDYSNILLSESVILFVPLPFGFRCRDYNADIKYSYSTLKELLANYSIEEEKNEKEKEKIKKHDT